MTDTVTPGPWRWDRRKIDGVWHAFLRGQPNKHNDDVVTAMRSDFASFPYAVDTANTRLIAAAPDLLAACRAALATLTDEPSIAKDGEAHALLVAALRKAGAP